jgi:hypothetical protein
MNKNHLLLILFLSLTIFGYSHFAKWVHLTTTEQGCKSEWGFFGHRRINRMAVFTLPQSMLGFYKKHIEYVTEHAVDPDKRRYATKHEAVRHYIDLDHWGEFPFDNVPRKWTDALLRYSDVYVVNAALDTVLLIGSPTSKDRDEKPLLATGADFLMLQDGSPTGISVKTYRNFFQQNVLGQYYEDEWLMDCDSLRHLLAGTNLIFNCQSAFVKDRFSGTGILPYHMMKMYYDLKEAYAGRQTERILRLSADYGHYIGDAHVPLHTTENYNGQLTNQVGIHAFWESRIPELFADREYDFFVGSATYIDDKEKFFWDVVLKSHAYVDSVLLIEKELSQTFPADKQFCFDNRLDAVVRVQCEDYVRAYSERMNGMVEERMRDAIYAIGCIWYSAWVDAGQPNINQLDLYEPDENFLKEQADADALYRKGEAKGRREEN